MSEPLLPLAEIVPAGTISANPAVAKAVADETTRAAQSREAARDITTQGQRRINLIWEVTQALIALAVTFTTLYVSAALVIRGAVDSASFLLLSNAFFLVVGFYFGRTNHQKVGGVGTHDEGR